MQSWPGPSELLILVSGLRQKLAEFLVLGGKDHTD